MTFGAIVGDARRDMIAQGRRKKQKYKATRDRQLNLRKKRKSNNNNVEQMIKHTDTRPSWLFVRTNYKPIK